MESKYTVNQVNDAAQTILVIGARKMNALKFGEGYIVYNSQPKVKIAIFDDGDNLVRIGTQGEWADAHEAAEDTGMNVLQRTPNVPEIFWT